MCVILDAYNNNTRMHIVKTRITHNSRKQTNKKKIKKGQKDVWHGSLMKSEARHATSTSLKLIDTLPIEDLHSEYGKELAKEIKRSYLPVGYKNPGKVYL